MSKKKLRRICKKHRLPLTRKCFRCKKPICKKGTLRKYHHFFCSKKCAYLWKVEQNENLLKFTREPLDTLPGKFLFYSSFTFFIGIFLFGIFNKPNLPPESKIYIKKINVKSENEFMLDVKRIITDEKIVCLTFDGGSYADRVDSIINILKREDVPATFFLTGEFIKKFPEKTKKIAKNFEVANHTYSHPHLTTFAINQIHKTLYNIDQIKILEELIRCEETFEKTTGKKIKRIWRAPYGEENYEIKKWAKRIGYTHIRWTYDTKDWMNENEKRFIPFKKVLKDILNKGDLKGYIFLLHAGSAGRNDNFYDFLKSLIKELKKRGYRFLSITPALKYHKILM